MRNNSTNNKSTNYMTFEVIETIDTYTISYLSDVRVKH